MIILKIGKMGAGKSAELIYDWTNDHGKVEQLVISSTESITSRNGQSIPINVNLKDFNNINFDMYDYDTHIYVDECQTDIRIYNKDYSLR